MVMHRLNRWFATLALFAAGVPLGAQVVRGVVSMPDSATRAAGVIIVATRDSAAPQRALTNQRGAFSIQLNGAGTYVLHALRIGFRPTVGPTIAVAKNDTVSVQIRLTGVSVSLAAVTVRGDDVCRTRPDSGALVARAWEEARKAIMASQLTATDAPLVAEWIEYSRTLEASGRVVRALKVRSTTSPTTHAFRSVPADSLAAHGYVIPEGEETSYHAPDGNVLLSDAFAATHCFQIVAPRAGADTLIGVAFRPARDNREIRDIEGTFWLDRRSAELRWMEYSYTNMPSIADKASPGGRVEFLHVRTGGWLIGKWNIRMPEFGRAMATSQRAGRVNVVQPSNNVLQAIQVSGGQVTKVMRGDTLVYQAAGAALEVQILSGDQFISPAGATVELVGTDYAATARADGRVRLSPVLEGRYDARISTTLMDTLGIPPIMREIEIGGRPRVDTVRLATPSELSRAACGDRMNDQSGLVRGTVRDSVGVPIANAAVVVSWMGSVKIGVQGNSDRVGWTEQTVGVLSDANGRWRACGVPRGVLFTVRVKTDAGSDARRTRLAEDQAMLVTDLVPHRVAATSDIVVAKENRALVEFWATDDQGTLVPGVTLEINLPGGGTRTLNTGTTGHALIPDVAPGRLTVQARKIGFRPGLIAVSIAAGRNTIPIIISSADFPTLDTVRIVGDERRRNDRLDEFETRRLNAAATRSITQAEIVKRNPTSAWHMLSSIPGIKVAENGGFVRALPTRVVQVSLLDNRPCFMKVAVDGVVWQDDPPNLAYLPPPDAIHGIEVFAGPASIPLQYGGTGKDKWCGLIAVWTR